MKYQYQLHQQEKAYDGFFKFNRHLVSFEKFDGGSIDNVWRECNEKGDIAVVIPYDPVKKKLLLIEQFRIGMAVRGNNPWTLEVIAGFMDIEGEDEITTAKRELQEETGCIAQTIHPLIEYYPGPGGSAGKVHVFIAEIEVSKAKRHTGLAEEGEDIRVHCVTVDKVKEKLNNREIDNATTMLALQYFFLEKWDKKLSKKTI